MQDSKPHPVRTREEDTGRVRDLADIIEAHDNPDPADDLAAALRGDNEEIDVSGALTAPHPGAAGDLSPTGDDGEAVDIDDAPLDNVLRDNEYDPDDDVYNSLESVMDSMNDTDPDPDAGRDEDETIGGAGLDRMPDITGTVTGIDRGMHTHLPQDIGSDGFQIEEPEESGDPRALEDPDAPSVGVSSADADGHRIPVRSEHADSADDALDATRRIE